MVISEEQYAEYKKIISLVNKKVKEKVTEESFHEILSNRMYSYIEDSEYHYHENPKKYRDVINFLKSIYPGFNKWDDPQMDEVAIFMKYCRDIRKGMIPLDDLQKKVIQEAYQINLNNCESPKTVTAPLSPTVSQDTVDEVEQNLIRPIKPKS